MYCSFKWKINIKFDSAGNDFILEKQDYFGLYSFPYLNKSFCWM